MYIDSHVHTSFSSDSDTPVEAQVQKAITLGMKALYITDHQDFDFPFEICHMTFQFDTTEYHSHLMQLKDQYKDQIDLRFGVELGLLPHLADKLASYTKEWDFDYCIGSTHLVRGMDPYYPDFYEGRSARDALMEYFETEYLNLQKNYAYVDSLGHLDYIVRYLPDGQAGVYPDPCFHEIIDAMLELAVEHDLALECNTSGLRKGMTDPNPEAGVIKRYIELGGKMVTIGSDAHVTEDLGYAFCQMGDYLKACGLKAYTTFIKREPHFELL